MQGGGEKAELQGETGAQGLQTPTTQIEPEQGDKEKRTNAEENGKRLHITERLDVIGEKARPVHRGKNRGSRKIDGRPRNSQSGPSATNQQETLSRNSRGSSQPPGISPVGAGNRSQARAVRLTYKTARSDKR